MKQKKQSIQILEPTKKEPQLPLTPPTLQEIIELGEQIKALQAKYPG